MYARIGNKIFQFDLINFPYLNSSPMSNSVFSGYSAPPFLKEQAISSLYTLCDIYNSSYIFNMPVMHYF